MSNRSASAKWVSSRFADPNMRNTRSSTSRSTPSTVHGFATRRGDMPIGEIHRVSSSNACIHVASPCSMLVERVRMGEEGPDRPCDRLAGLVLPSADRELDVGASLRLREASLEHHAEEGVVGSAAHDREHVVDRRVDGRGRFVATPFDLGIAVVVRDALDHRLRPRVHVLVADVGQAGHRLQALGRERERERVDEVAARPGRRGRRGCGRRDVGTVPANGQRPPRARWRGE